MIKFIEAEQANHLDPPSLGTKNDASLPVLAGTYRPDFRLRVPCSLTNSQNVSVCNSRIIVLWETFVYFSLYLTPVLVENEN